MPPPIAQMPDLGVDNADNATDVTALHELDDIFKARVGAAPSTRTTTTAPGARKPLIPKLGLTAEQEKYAATGTGAIVGPAVQTTLAKVFPTEEARLAEGVKKLNEQQKVAKLLQQLEEEQLIRAGIKPSNLPAGADTSGTKWLRNWAGIDKPIAGGVPEAASVYDRSKGQGKITSRMTKRFGPMPAGEPGKPMESLVDRLMRTSREADAIAAQADAIAAQRATAETAAKTSAAAQLKAATPGPLSKVGSIMKSPGVMGPLAGGFAGLSFYEALQRFKEGDTSGAVINALGGIGGLMTLIPGLQLPGMAISGGSAAAQLLNDRIQQKLKEEEAAPPQE